MSAYDSSVPKVITIRLSGVRIARMSDAGPDAISTEEMQIIEAVSKAIDDLRLPKNEFVSSYRLSTDIAEDRDAQMLDTLSTITRHLKDLSDEERSTVLNYINSRFPAKDPE